MLVQRIGKLIKILQTKYYFQALVRFGVAAGVDHAKMFNHLLSKDFQTVVDVGANRGQFALVARKHLPNAKIVSFEPLKEPAAIFRRVFSKDSLVILYEMAIGPAEREMAIHVSHADDSSSLLSITAMQNSLFPGTAEKETRPVQVKPLGTVLSSQLIKSPALLKIDVQGFELEVLKGSEDILGKFTHAYIECSFIELYEGQALAHEIIAWLEIRKFYFTGVYNVSYDRNGKAVQGDFLFTRIDENG